jgi:DNA-binding MarR family transcriptional regulator
VRGLARRLTAVYDAELAPHGLTVTQYAALAALVRSDEPLAVAELARRLQMDRTTASRLIGPLEAEGLVGRSPAGTGDARARPLRPTPKGKRRLQASIPAWTTAQRTVESILGGELWASLHKSAEAAGRALAAAAIEPVEEL